VAGGNPVLAEVELVTATGNRRIPAGREQRWPLASTTCRRISAKLGVKDLTAYWKEASPMSNRDFGVAASAHHPTGP
jgi:hypothetical protein